jgi:pyridoxal phosphate enzyme (YggS family)
VNDDAPVTERYGWIRDRIEDACRRSGRQAGSVTLVGASKNQAPALLAEAWAAGVRVFGENRVQEAVTKSHELPSGIEWHLIGPLQSNKVRPAVELFRAVHSIDRPRIAEALNREAVARGRRLDGFLEINLGHEENKHGFVPEGLAAAVRPLAGLAHLRIAGLMAIPPPGKTPEDSRPWFRKLRELRDDLASRPEWQGFPGWLSMGMSDDFEVAVEEGATHVRVGSALFGNRGPRGPRLAT